MGEEETLLAEASAIGDWLAERAIWHAERCTWIAAHREPGPHGGPFAFTLESSVHSGTAGVAMFLARLARATGERRHRRAAKGALAHALKHAWHEDRAKTLVAAQTGGAWRLGPYLGALGVAWAADEVALALGEPSRGRALRRSVLATRRRAHGWDLMQGSAGAAGLLARSEPDVAFSLAREVARRAPEVEAAGFSHGLSGAAWALSLFPETREAAREAFLREEALPRERETWCHGAPGMGLARALAGEPSRALRAQAQARLDWLLERPGELFHLCCGVAGVAACLHAMDDALGEPGALARSRAVARWGMERYQAGEPWRGWPTGALVDAHPGLMQGVAGIGHWLLELAQPGRVPSALAPIPSA